MPGRPSIYQSARINDRKDTYDYLPRKLELALLLLPAFLIVWLPPWANLILALLILGYCGLLSERLLPQALLMTDQTTNFDFGKVAFGGMILVLMIIFRNKLFIVAGAWAIMALGDGAATLVGQKIGGPKIIWNRQKTFAGTAAFMIVGTLAATILIYWVNYPPEPFPFGFALKTAAMAAGLATIVESLPLPVDDNVTVPVAAGIIMAAYTHPFLMQANHSIW